MNIAKKIFPLLFIVLVLSCKNSKEKITLEAIADVLVDKSILASGGELYKTKDIAFNFRNKHYTLLWKDGKKILQRSFVEDSITYKDIKAQNFRRFVNGEEVSIIDSMAVNYSNSINSVFYFALLPYGLNDPAVHKKFLDDVKIGGKEYYKIRVTFDEKNGGEDFDDVYLYWFNKETYEPDYLAYKFMTDGGGMRFRVAYNQRFVNRIRFTDYENYAPKSKDIDFLKIDDYYSRKELKLLSKIELTDITVQ